MPSFGLRVIVTPDSDFVLPLFLGSFLGSDTVEVASGAVASQHPVEVVLCLDASRSMHRTPEDEKLGGFESPPQPGSKWFILRDRVQEFLGNLALKNDAIKVSLVTFGGGHSEPKWGESPLDADPVRFELPLENVADVTPHVIQVMDEYSETTLGLGTYIYDSLEMSIDVLEDGNSKATKMIVILTDGAQWVSPGETETPPVDAAVRANILNIKIHTVNFQTKANKQLVAVSDEANGLHFDAGSDGELGDAFNQLLDAFKIRLAD